MNLELVKNNIEFVITVKKRVNIQDDLLNNKKLI